MSSSVIFIFRCSFFVFHSSQHVDNSMFWSIFTTALLRFLSAETFIPSFLSFLVLLVYFSSGYESLIRTTLHSGDLGLDAKHCQFTLLSVGFCSSTSLLEVNLVVLTFTFSFVRTDFHP